MSLFGFFLNFMVDSLFTISYYDNICFPRMHLIQCIHQKWESLVIENKQENNSFLWLITGYKGNRPMFHFTCAHRLRMNIIELLNFQRSFPGNRQPLPQGQQVNRLFLINKFGEFLTRPLHHLNASLRYSWSIQEAKSYLFYKPHVSRLFFLGHQGCVVNKV